MADMVDQLNEWCYAEYQKELKMKRVKNRLYGYGITEGNIKKNTNPPPTSERPSPPRSQIAQQLVKMRPVRTTNKIPVGHKHRRPKKIDFEGKTVKRFICTADNVWKFYFTDGSEFAIQSELHFGLPIMELCETCS
jgi:hypothetical protein